MKLQMLYNRIKKHLTQDDYLEFSFRTLFIYSLVGVVCISFGLFHISSPDESILGLTQSVATKTTDTDFNEGTLSSVEVSGTGSGAVLQLQGGTGGGDPWWNLSWSYRRKIIFNNSDAHLGVASEVLTNFPVLIKLDSESDIDYSLTKDNGEDLRFTDSDGAALSYEIEQWNESGSSYVWVKVPQIDQNSTTDFIYVYYGNTGASDNQDADLVWSNNYGMVQHLKDATTSTIIDSTSNNYLGNKKTVNQPLEIAGQIGKAQQFGSDHYINLGDILNPGASDLTVEIWFRRQTIGAGDGNILYNKENLWETAAGGGYVRYAWMPHWAWDGLTTASLSLNQWQKSTIVYNHSQQIMYKNGNQVYARNQTGNIGTNTAYLQIGARGDRVHSSFFVGDIDEMRVSTVARSSAWLAAAYSSDSDTFTSFGTEETSLPPSGTWVSASNSNVIDLGWNGGWGDGTDGSTAFSATVASVDANATITFKMRVADSVSNLLSSTWTTLGIANSGTTFTKTKAELDTLGVATGSNRYVQIGVDFASSDGVTNPQLDAFTLSYQADLDLPTNPTALTAKDSNGGSTDLTSGQWYNYPTPYFSWIGATDDDSAIGGYYVYFGTNSGANPLSEGIFQEESTFSGSSLVNDTTYYLRIKAVDVAGNPASSIWAPFNYVYDSGEPYNPSKPSVIPAGYTSTNSFLFIWQDNGDDDESGLWGYCYKTGTSDDQSIYYTDQCIQGTQVSNVPAYQNGANIFYLRSLDNTGNKNSYYKELNYYYNTTAPSEPRNIVITSATSLIGTTCNSLDNCYEVTWVEPATYTGSIETYYYSVNEEPTILNSTEITTSETSAHTLAGRSLATKQGTNIFYIVAQDDSGTIEWTLYGEQNFEASTSAPGIPSNFQVTDSSNRDATQYQLTLTWNEPTYTGSGIDHYNIYRSTDDVTFSKIGTVPGASTGYLDTGLDNTTRYYYKITAEDNAGAEGSFTSVVDEIPTGRYTTPPSMLVPPTVETSIMSATVSWQMDRTCQGYVQLRTTLEGTYSEQGSGESDTEQNVTVVGLQPNTMYYYRTKCQDIDGNIGYSTEDTFTTNDAPSAPTDVTVTPSTNTSNSFAFSWEAPSDIGITIDYYYYSINQEPTESNVTKTSATSLDAGPYATQQGVNIFYVVGVDISGNYNLDNFASVDFIADTAAPGIPLNVQVTDSSDRANEAYRLTVAWNEPTIGTVSQYNVFRSTAGGVYELVAEVSSLGFLDTGLATTNMYYYKITAQDNAGAVSAYSSIVSKQPTGRYAIPPSYTSNPVTSVTSSTATLFWTTDRASSSFANYGVTTDLGQSKGSLEEVTAHEVELTGLNPSTIYYYKVQSFDEARDYDLEESLSDLYTFTTSVAPAISDVKVEDVRQTSALVRWKTTTVSTSVIKYGKTNNYGLEVNDVSSGATTIHTVKLDNLNAENLYHVRITGTDNEGNDLQSDDYVFQTLAFPRIFNLGFEPVEESSSATIKVAWETNVETDSIIEFAPEGQSFSEEARSELLIEHELVLSDLLDNTIYQFRAKGRDQYGNVTTSETQTYETPFDTRPPKISEIEIETSIQGTGADAKAQIIISWKTDENATSQVEYGEGVGGTSYTNKTVEDGTLVNSHVVIISDLTASKSYHLRVVSKDNAGNETKSQDNVTITGRATESVFDLIIGNLQDIFGWVENVQDFSNIFQF